MKIDRILAGIRESQQAEKQAGETAPTTPPPAEKTSSAPALVNALHEALKPSEKTASETPAKSPVDDVMKVAQDLASAEKEAALKEAQLLGAAFADSAIARMTEWNKTAAAMVAASPAAPAAPAAPASNFGKFAQDNQALVQEAAKLGYEQAKAELEKQAEESYVQGYNDTVETIHKTAALEFLKAASITAEIIKASTAAK